MQKFINEPARTVNDYLRGLELAHHGQLRVQLTPRFVVRSDAPVAGKVTIMSGSGSGHEPLNAGYVGRGMLDAAIPGEIFTSPTPDQYLAAIDASHGGKGVVLIVKNYAGGVLNTEVAMEMAEAAGVPIGAVLVSDDVAVPDRTRRRGMGAAVLVAKIAGAAAEAGASFEEVLRVARHTSANARSMGVALSGCTSPAVGAPAFQLPAGQMEIGVGIHGEAGRRRAPILGADAIARLLLDSIVSDLDLHPGERVLALVSGLGGTPQQELYIVYGRVHQALEAQGIRVARSLVGEYVTSLDMSGAAITLLRLDDELLRLWDAPVSTPTFRW
ncbi:MAG: dihydroxyacetone kinase subunit DhaK [Caldilineaceae bacterium]